MFLKQGINSKNLEVVGCSSTITVVKNSLKILNWL